MRFAGAVLLLCTMAAAARAGDPERRWHVLETDHFVVHYYEPHEDIGRRVAVVAERAHRVVTQALRHVPREKTLLVVTDDTDGANGFASVLPRNAIHVFASAPAPTSVLGDHDDWLYDLVLHEYTHIVHLDTIEGLPALWNRLWGKVWAPNQTQPRWFIEGLATYEESKRTSSGRTRSAIFDMYLRMSVLAGDELDIAQVSSGPLEWPHGTAIYLYGSHFLKYVADRYGDDKLAEISHSYGRHPIPWNLGRAVRQAVGRNYEELYDEWTLYLRRKYQLQLAAVERRGRIEGRQITDTGERNGGARYSPDGRWLAWSQSDGLSRPHFRRLPIGAAGGGDRWFELEGAGHLRFVPGGGLLLQRSYVYRSQYDFTDLVLYDAGEARVTRLSHGLRAMDPEPSPDGRRAAVVLNAGSRSRLAIVDLVPAADPAIFWQGEGRFDQAAAPAWSPDGKRIAFSGWTRGGYRDLFVHDLAAGTTMRLMHDRASDADPVWSPDGRWIFFSSDRSGIFNIYALDPVTRVCRQVTNVLGGAFEPAVSPDGRRLAYTGYDQDGFELFELVLDPDRWLVPEPYVNDRPDPVDVPDDEVAVAGPRAYRPLETIAPSSWEAQLTVDAYGTAINVLTRGGDAAGYHTYGIGATVGIERGDVGFGMGYAYNRLWPSLGFSVARGVGRAGGLVLDGRNTAYTEETWIGAFAMGLPVLRRPEVASDLSFSYDVIQNRNIDGELVFDPSMAVPVAPETGTVAALGMAWSLSNVRRYAFTLGPTEGRGLFAGLRYSHPGLGSDFESAEASYRWQEYLAMPWPGRHALAFRLAGAIETTNRRRDGSYALGGLPRQDIVSSIRNTLRAGGTAYLRGYPPGIVRGRQYHLMNLEYRVPILDVERGVNTIPFYVRRLHVAALLDAGNAFQGAFEPEDLKIAVGASLRLDVVFGFFADGSFDLGYAHGLSPGGLGQYWLLLTQTL